MDMVVVGEVERSIQVFIIGLLSGVVLCLTIRALLLEWLPRPQAAAPATAASTQSKGWGLTHNFLYYDGTVMPEIKEDMNE